MAAVNTVDFGSGASNTLTTSPGVTPGGSNRAVWVGTLTQGDTPNYTTGVTWNSGGSTAIDAYIGADTPFSLFGFAFAYSKTFGRVGSPAALTTLTASWATDDLVFALGAFYLEDVDQTTAFGAEQVGTEQFLGDDPAVVADELTGLTPGALVISFLYLFSLGASPGATFTAAGDVDTIHGSSAYLEIDGRCVTVVAFSGNADGSGNYEAAVSVDWSNSGELIEAVIVSRPVNHGGGGPTTVVNPLSGRGGAAAQPLAV